MDDYCAISRLGFIPVVRREMMESVEDVLVRHTSEAGWRVGPWDESGSGGGHGRVRVVSGKSAGTRRDVDWRRGGGYKGRSDKGTYCPVWITLNV